MCLVLPRGSCRDKDVIHHGGRSVSAHRDRDNETDMAFNVGFAFFYCIPLGVRARLEREHRFFFFLIIWGASYHRHGG